MSQLHNKRSREELRQEVREKNEDRYTISFYRYAHIEYPKAFRDDLYQAWKEIGVLGRTYVATEGINAQISVPVRTFESFKEHLDSYDFLQNLRLNLARQQDNASFFSLDIKVRKKIVADGIEDPKFDPTNIGQHLKADEFNELIQQPGTVLIDMRNHYESEVGHFRNAVCPDVDTFRESLPIIKDMLEDKKEQKVVMYCTGGIRCEKASAYLKHQGFENVYQLEGGIIEYDRQVKEKKLPNLFRGKNFVFDERLGERITDEIISTCHQCGKPADTHTNCRNKACHLLFIQCEECAKKFEGCCCNECKEINRLPEEEQKALRQGVKKGRQVFKKGRLPKGGLLK